MSTFDLSSISAIAKDEEWVEITHPVSGVLTGIRIKVASPDSVIHQRVNNAVKNRSLQSINKRGKVTAEAITASALDLLVGTTLGWEGVSFNDSPLEFSAENVRQVYTDFPFIKEQVDAFIGDRANFFGN